ncbi:MAG: amidohydrolase family protein [Phycisphaerae bacterium]
METYRAQWIIPVESPPVEDGLLAVDGGRIAWLGSADRFRERISKQDRIHDLGDCILLPGLINAHTHLDLTGYRGRLSPGPLFTWIEELIALRMANETDAPERAAVRAGAAESLTAGVTCVGDITRNRATLEQLRESPIRKVCFLELISGALQAPNDTGSLKSLLERWTPLADPERLILGISPHAPYSVTRDDLAGAAALANSTGAPFSMHLLETMEEVQWLAGGGGPVLDFLKTRNAPNASESRNDDVFERLELSGVLDGSPLFAHVNYVTDEQIDRLADCAASVAWCPRAHRFFGHEPHRWREMLDRSVNVCLGTDSAASNESLSILDEMRQVRAEYPDVPPETILEMGTIRGARGLGLDHLVGSLKADKRADFIAVPIDTDEPSNPATNLLDGAAPVIGTWIDGVDMDPSRSAGVMPSNDPRS